MLKEFFSWYLKPSPKWVEKRVLELVKHAWEHVPFYREKMVRAGLTPSDITCLKDYVDKFPTTSAAEYRAYQNAGDSKGLIDKRLDKTTLREDRSSGSSGAYLSIHRTGRELEINRGRSLWYLLRAGLRPWHRVLAVIHPSRMEHHRSFLQTLGIFRRITVSYLTPVEEIAAIIDREKINAMYGQKSYLRLIANYYHDRLIPGPKLQLIIPGAELLSSGDRRLFEEVFRPTRFREFYGASETYFIAAKHEGDFEPDYKAVFFSLVDPKPHNNLVKGSIAATSLINEAQPILGLELGDLVVVRNYESLDKLGASIVELEGRNNDFLVLSNGDQLSCARFCGALDVFPFVREFKIIQDNLTEFTLLLKIEQVSPSECLNLERSVIAATEGKITCIFKYVDNIPLDPNGKAKILSSQVNKG